MYFTINISLLKYYIFTDTALFQRLARYPTRDVDINKTYHLQYCFEPGLRRTWFVIQYDL